MQICVHFSWADLCWVIWCVFNFVRHWQTVFPGGCIILHSRQQCMRVLVPPHPREHLILSVVNFSHSARCMVVAHEVSVCISLITSGVEYLFMYLYATLYLC